jgi:single-strand DNA-binding protein
MDRNKIELAGRLTRDPELKNTVNGSVIAEIGLATNRKYRKNDELQEETLFVDVTFFGQQAETLGKYLTKGSPIFIDGRLKLDSWEDRETGKTRSRLKVIGESFTFIGGGQGGDRQAKPQQRQQRQPQPQQQSPLMDDDEGDDIPF